MSENNGRNIVTIRFDKAMTLVKYAADYDSVVEYIERKKTNNEYLIKGELALLLCQNVHSESRDDVEVPIPADRMFELMSKASIVEAAKRYIEHGISGEYIDEDAFYCMFHVDVRKKESGCGNELG